jgi:hypothetical protein
MVTFISSGTLCAGSHREVQTHGFNELSYWKRIVFPE